jgi:hypothetical protein
MNRLTALTLFVLLLIHFPVQAQESATLIATSDQQVSLYSETNTSSAVVATIEAGVLFKVEDRIGSFYSATDVAGSSKGFVLKNTVSPVGPDTYESYLRQPGATAFIFNWDDHAVLEGPDTLSAGVSLPYGEPVVVFASAGDFYLVATKAGGFVGYILASTVADVERGSLREFNPGKTLIPDPISYLPAMARSPQSVYQPVVIQKDPSLAAVLSFLVPGGGHLYAGEEGTGILLLAGGTLSLLIGTQTAAEQILDCTTNCDTAGDGALFFGVAAYVGAWVYGMIDGPEAARRANARIAPTMSYSGRPAVKLTMQF